MTALLAEWWGAILMASTPLIAWLMVRIVDWIAPTWPGGDYDPNVEYDWDQQPFGGELR